MRKIYSAKHDMNRLKIILGGLLYMLSAAASAVEINIKGVFTPDPARPEFNKFTITSEGNLCGTGNISSCDSSRYHIIRFSNPGVNIKREVPLNTNNPGIEDDEWVYLHARNPVHAVTLTDEYNNSFDGRLEITHLGSGNYIGPQEAQDRPCINDACSSVGLFESSCSVASRTGYGIWVNTTYVLPDSKKCIAKVRQQKLDLNYLRYIQMDVGFIFLSNTQPLQLKSGRYRGNLRLTLGEVGNEDIYVGKNKQISAGNQVININLDFTVTHMLKVEALGGTSVPLQPSGGWQSWLANASPPTQLSGDSIFKLSASTPFSMRLLCQHAGLDGNCALQSRLDPNKHVTVKTMVSMPAGISANGQPVQRYPLSTLASNTFTPMNYISSRPGTLHFQIAKEQVAEILNDGEKTARRYGGDITVIWDANI